MRARRLVLYAALMPLLCGCATLRYYSQAVSGQLDLMARVLAGRGVRFDEVARYLDPTLRELMPDPGVFHVGEPGDGLIVDLDLIAFQGPAQFGFEGYEFTAVIAHR